MQLPTLLDMLKAGVHFGHVSSKRHPKMRPFIFGVRSGINIIDLEVTSKKLEQALQYVENETAKGSVVLFVGAKKQAQEIIKSAASSCDMPYVDERWIGGMLTNFSEIHKIIKRYNELTKDFAVGKYDSLTKKARLELEREMKRLASKVSGIKNLIKIPDILFVVDIKKEKTAVTEANKVGLPIIAMVDSNVNPEQTTYPIPANDDAVKSITIITNLIAEAVKAGRAQWLKDQPVPVLVKAVVKKITPIEKDQEPGLVLADKKIKKTIKKD